LPLIGEPHPIVVSPVYDLYNNVISPIPVRKIERTIPVRKKERNITGKKKGRNIYR
jgi:hypothetical protein